ncbi:hypothetical protein FALCPG4_012117 [Fusarium falciforme]
MHGSAGYGLLDPTQSWGPPGQTARARHPWQVSSLPYDRLRELDRTGPSDPDNPAGPLPDETLRRRHHGDETLQRESSRLCPCLCSWLCKPLLLMDGAWLPQDQGAGLGSAYTQNDVVATQPGHSLLWWITMRSLHILGSYMFQAPSLAIK